VSEAEVLMEGVVFGESRRWRDGRLWFSDWIPNQVIALGTDGSHEEVVAVEVAGRAPAKVSECAGPRRLVARL
jgi:hypothetical protein